MSKSQIKRLHQQQELEKAANLEEEEEKEPVQRKGPANRFAFFDDEDNEDTGNQSDENVNEEGTSASAVSQKANKKKAKKNKKKAKKAAEEDEESENQMLARLAALNAKEAKKAATSEPLIPSLEELMKIDMKLFDMSAEIKRKLGKAFKEAVTPGQQEEHRWPPGKRATGRIVKNKPRWFPDRDYGISMVQTGEEGGNQWFSLRHNSSYEQKERMYWIAESHINAEVVQDLFSDTPFHLNSLLMMAHMNRMNDDLNVAADLIERGIWYVDQHAHPLFEPFHWRHRMDYIDYENRAFYLLLHRHMLNAANKRCYETAWNTAKLIFKLDPVKDPLAIVSVIDIYALKAKQYTWLIHFYESAKKFKKLHLLPNWPYSVALAKFFVFKTDEEREIAESDLCSAIRHFPSVVVQLMDLLQIHPDLAVMNCKMFTSFVADNEKDSLKLLVKIYAKQTQEVWKENLLLLEGATRKVATSKDAKENSECEEWREKRNKMYHGRSPNVDRLGQLMEEIPSESVSDPVPPQNSRCQYERVPGPAANNGGSNSFFGGLLTSLIPHFNGEESFEAQFSRYGAHFLDFILDHVGAVEEAVGPAADVAARWFRRRDEIDAERAIEAATIRRLENQEALNLDFFEDPDDLSADDEEEGEEGEEEENEGGHENEQRQ
uniref:Transcription factor 25 n=1 Tax=Caenorhabditis tropicalis TaxID=1561998 RepID=A0A1I7V4H6_9PELO